MQRLAIVTSVVLIVVLVSPNEAEAQTEKKLQYEDMHGQTVQTPYISYDVYQSITVNGRIPFRKLLSVSSVDEIIRSLGKPETIDRQEFSGRERFGAVLHYEGATVEYDRYEGGVSGITSIEIRSPDWSLTVGGTKLRPGMSVDRLSPAVRESLQKDTTFDDPKIDSFGIVHITAPDLGKSGEVKLLQDGRSQITVHVNEESNTIVMVRFGRLGP